MQNSDQKNQWEAYRARDLAAALPVLKGLGLALDEQQPHIQGERYLMSGKKLVLMGLRASDRKRVVIKISSDASGKREIASERAARETLRQLKFAYYDFLMPKEMLYEARGAFLIFITEFIDQDKPFVSRELSEQFYLALRAFKMQEGAHATARSHTRAVRRTFGIWGAKEYAGSLRTLSDEATRAYGSSKILSEALLKAGGFIASNQETVEQYCGFLTHTDFVPHNMRVHEGEIYLLDYSSLRFGNKYESWARFLNFMLLYNRPLEQALVQYVRDNRTLEELMSLRLMRAYKIVFLLSFYARSLGSTQGDLHALTMARIEFWSGVLISIVDGKDIEEGSIAEYKRTRDSLRSEEEKLRQVGLH